MKVINDEQLETSLSSGSKKRFHDFKKQLSTDRLNVIFDDKVLNVIEKYCIDQSQVAAVRKYLNECLDQDGIQFCQSIKQYAKLEDAFHLFSQPDYTSFRWNRHYQQALKEMIDEYSIYRLTCLRYSCDEDLINALPKVNTHSGWTYIRTGSKKKGDNMEDVFSTYTCVVNKAIEEGSFNVPILPGVRTQASGAFEDDGTFTGTCKHKTRLVSMVDLYQVLAELRFAKPFQKIFCQKSYYAGGKSTTLISQEISNLRMKFGHYISLDYSHFDQSISSWLIEDAFKIIRASFSDMSDQDQKLWDVVIEDFIHKNFVTANGVVHSDKGVPSGSMFTQIIDSLVNILMIKTFLIAKGERGGMIVMGDDNLLYTNYHFDKYEIATYLSKNFGVEVNADKTTEGSMRDDPQFLSRSWRANGQWRHPNVLLSKLIYPERFRVYDDVVTPELIVYSYILAYQLGMESLIHVHKFLQDFDFRPSDVGMVDSRNLPGYLRYMNLYSPAKISGV